MDALDRLYWRLVETLRPEDAAPESTLTVASLYQSIIPYRSVRAELGLLELAKYEHALLRLLAGERGYVVLDPASAQEELRRELASPNPILGLYRDYADAGVRLNRPAAGQLAALEPTPASPASPATPAMPAAAPLPIAPGMACASCLQALPRGREARFCPFCGTRQPERCRGCGEVLEESWRFCIDCGEPRPAPSAVAERA